jgi:hypothetical protein
MTAESPDPETPEVEALARLCRQFGATPPQDVLMARKLLERAGQIARTRDIDKLEALQYLLSLLKNAREGTHAGDSASPEGSERSIDPEKLNKRQENR